MKQQFLISAILLASAVLGSDAAAQYNPMLVPLFRSDVGGAAAKAEKVQVCLEGDACEVTVTVRKHGIHQRRCVPTVDTPILVVMGTKPRTIIWKIIPQGGDDYRFDPKTGVDVGGNDEPSEPDREFEDGDGDDTTSTRTFAVKQRKFSGHKNLAYSYNVIVQRNHGTAVNPMWRQCGMVDPVIVNRD